MLMLLKAALVICTVELEEDDTYFSVCSGRRERMESTILGQIEKDKMGTFCTVYTYTEWKEGYQSFVAVCE